MVKAERVERERAPIIDGRKKVIKRLYATYKETLVPTRWAYLPDDDEVYTFEAFASLIDDPSEVGLEYAMCREALRKLPAFLNAHTEKKKANLLSLLSDGEGLDQTNNEVAGYPGRTPLDLATSIFQCTTTGCRGQYGPLVAWQRAVCHSCKAQKRPDFYGYTHRDVKPDLRFSDRGLKAVESLAPLLGLDARTAIPAEYDQKAARFICLECNVLDRSGIRGREAFTWRECVSGSRPKVYYCN
jgi:hypothetical protein